ncbi:MAG: DEAD/DEAH box helicase family protein [Thermoleophilia bacterium]
MSAFDGLRFDGAWRHYQQLALDAFERDRTEGSRHTHVVAPPGSGKTLMGLEVVRRLGVPALVLAPNTAVQAQWIEAGAMFDAPPGLVTTDATGTIACLTYQGVSRLDDPAEVLGDVAERRWAAERARATGSSLDAMLTEGRLWTGAAAQRRRRELAVIGRGIKREIARAEHGDLHVGALFSESVRKRLDLLRERGVGTIVLDECHHLASMWGYVVRAIVEEFGDVHLVGLTATPPADLSRDEAELYEHLLGPVDFTVPTQAVVRDGHLAPYQELACLTTPLDSELRWLAERDTRFKELITTLHEHDEAGLGFAEWIAHRLRTRMRAEGDGANLSWGSFARREPTFAAAGLRMLTSAGLPLPDGAPKSEAVRTQPNLDDWLVLIEDYVLRCLDPQPEEAVGRRREAIVAALAELGYTMTRRGVRRGRSDVDRLLARSAAKAVVLADIIACELDVRADGLRALVLTDSERSDTVASLDLTSVMRPEAGTAVEAVHAIAADARTTICRPVLVTGRGIRCHPDDADRLVSCLVEAADGEIDGLEWRLDEDGLADITATGAWTPRRWVPLATAALAAGDVLVLVGTRGMLGEGWNAPSLNVVVDMTGAATSVAVTQMRGRSLRLDPRDPGKVASNWDVVCVAPDLLQGDGDYRRFVRKHTHVFAPTDDGEIEAGPSHVHPALGPFASPPAERFGEINRELFARAADHDDARRRWRLGEAYEGVEVDSVVVRHRRQGVAVQDAATPVCPDRLGHAPVAGPLTLGALSAAAAVAGAVAVGPVGWAALAGVPFAAGWLARRRHAAARLLEPELPLDLVAGAIRDAYVALGEISEASGASLVIEPRSSGYLRVWLASATPAEAARFASALEDLLDPSAPRYLVSRPVPPLGTGASLRIAFGRRWTAPHWIPVPADLGRRKDRAQAFADACERWLGRGLLVSATRTAEGQDAFARAHETGASMDVVRRRVWR